MAANVAYLTTLGFSVASPLASILFKDYRRRVLGLLLLHPEKQYHVREVARVTSKWLSNINEQAGTSPNYEPVFEKIDWH